MQVSSGVIKIFPVLDADQVRDLRRIVQAAIPAGKPPAIKKGRSQAAVLCLCEFLEMLVNIVFAPGDSERLVSGQAQSLRASDERRIADIENAICRVHLTTKRTCRVSRTILRSSACSKLRSSRHTSAVGQRQNVTVTAI